LDDDDEGSAAIVLVDRDVSVQLTLLCEIYGHVQSEGDADSTR
jgi:hypothetical protein